MHPPRLVIAGTGRAGTTFLVRFLAACGIPAGDLDALPYFPEARAGLERNLLAADDGQLVKDPWLFEYLRHVDLANTNIAAVIIPVRNLRQASMSRIRQERLKRFEQGLAPDRMTQGGVPGGALYSMSVQDQERVLAVGQTRLIEWCLAHSIPLVLLHFPRIVEDAEYLVDALWPILVRHCTRDDAITAFRALADLRPSVPADHDDEDPERADWLLQLDAATEGMDHLRQKILAGAVQIAALEEARSLADQHVAAQTMTIDTLRKVVVDLTDQLRATSAQIARLEIAANVEAPQSWYRRRRRRQPTGLREPGAGA